MGEERQESPLSPAVFSVPKHLVGTRLPHCVVLVFKDTSFPYDLAPKHKPKTLCQVLSWRRSSFHTKGETSQCGTY